MVSGSGLVSFQKSQLSVYIGNDKLFHGFLLQI